jgi:S-DNA-T family DNA segregation ATPase FtsK/SpoIIIE
MANDDEYSYLGLARSVYQGASMPPGRGFTEQELEIQCAIPGEHPAGGAQAAAIEDLGAELASRYPEAAVPAVRLLPAEVPRASLPAPERPLQALIGLQDGDLIPARVDLSEGHVLVAGPRRSGRTTTLAAFATSLHRGPGAAPLFLLAPRRQSSLPELAFWKEAAVGLDACADLARRLAAAVAGESREIDLSQGAVILLDDGENLVDVPGSTELESVAQRGGDLNVRLVTAIETQAAHRAFGGWVTQVQRDRHGFLLDPDSALDGALVGGVRLPLRRGPMPPGRGYLVRAGIVTLVQVAKE